MVDHQRGADSGRDAELHRRRFLQVAGAASAPGLASWTGSAEARDVEQAQQQSMASVQSSSPTLEIGENLNLGGRRIVGGPDAIGYDTIQDAWEAANDGDVIFVHGAYDAETAGEPLPITLDYREKEVMLSGGHPSGSVIDARHAPDTNVVEVVGKASDDYRNKALVQHLKIRGGDVGIRIRGATYSTYKDIVVYNTTGDGILVDEFTDASGQTKGAFGITFRSCMAWRCGGSGFRLHPRASPHGTTFYGCDALFNGFENGDPGVALRGYSSRWVNGVVQNNAGFGIDARSGASQAVKDAYFEGNGMAAEYPHGVFVDESSPGFVLKGCYFQGGFFRDAPNGLDQGYRGVAVAGAEGVELSGCTYKNYTDAFLHLRNTTDADVHVASHTDLDDTPLQNSWNNTRLRSSGLVLKTDLRGGTPPGQYEGDYGIHDGSGQSPWGLAIWDGEDWISVMNGKVIR